MSCDTNFTNVWGPDYTREPNPGLGVRRDVGRSVVSYVGGEPCTSHLQVVCVHSALLVSPRLVTVKSLRSSVVTSVSDGFPSSDRYSHSTDGTAPPSTGSLFVSFRDDERGFRLG